MCLHLPLSVVMVNDELLQRLTNGKASLSKPLVIHRSSETTVPLDYHSPPEEVAEWLRGKGFSEPCVMSQPEKLQSHHPKLGFGLSAVLCLPRSVSCLGVLTGAQLFSLNKDELRAVIPEEGARVYSQLTVQKALLEVDVELEPALWASYH